MEYLNGVVMGGLPLLAPRQTREQLCTAFREGNGSVCTPSIGSN